MGSNPMRCARRAYESILTIVSAPQDVPKIRFRQSKLWCTRDREASAYKVPPTYLQSFSIPPNLQFHNRTLKEVIIVASNQEEAVKRASRDAGKGSKEEAAAYDAYCTSMRRAGQNPKQLNDLR